MANLSKLKKKMKQAAAKPSAPWKIIVFSSVKALIVTMMILALLSFLITYSSLPEKIVPIATTALSIFVVLFTSKRVSKKIGKKGFMHGALTGLCFMFLMAIMGSVFTPLLPFAFILSYWPMLVSGVVGGIWGV